MAAGFIFAGLETLLVGISMVMRTRKRSVIISLFGKTAYGNSHSVFPLRLERLGSDGLGRSVVIRISLPLFFVCLALGPLLAHVR